MIITECKMEDLSDLSKQKVVSAFIVCQLVGAGTDFPAHMSSYRCNFARLVDKAVSEYSNAREFVLAEIEEPKRPMKELMKGRLIYIHFISNELENCITTVKRLFNYFEKIKSDKTRFPIDKTFKLKVASLEDSIRTVRDLIQHLEDDIHGGRLQQGDVAAPVFNEDATRIMMSSSILISSDLSRVIRYFHQFGLDFMSQKFSDQNGYEKI